MGAKKGGYLSGSMVGVGNQLAFFFFLICGWEPIHLESKKKIK